jgi:hypothetical protein
MRGETSGTDGIRPDSWPRDRHRHRRGFRVIVVRCGVEVPFGDRRQPVGLDRASFRAVIIRQVGITIEEEQV